MGRAKYNKFTAAHLSDDTINAIRKDITKQPGIADDDYDWLVLDIRIKRANKAQRHRFADTIQKLESYIKTQEAGCSYQEIYSEVEHKWIYDYVIGIASFAEISSRNIKTIRDWMEKEFLASTCRGTRWYILTERTIEKLKKLKSLQQ